MCLSGWGGSSAPWSLAKEQGGKDITELCLFYFSLSTDFPRLSSRDNAMVQ